MISSVLPVLVPCKNSIMLSGFQCLAAVGPARGSILALHGGGYSSGYWNCPVGGGSLMDLAAQLGFNVLALDRPGYGRAADIDPTRLGLQSQVEILFDAIDAWSGENDFGGPWFVIGHSVGGILALLMAAHERSKKLSGVDVLGVPVRFPASHAGEAINSLPMEGTMVPPISDDARKWLLFGPADTYDAQAFEYDATLVRPMPVLEYCESLAVPDDWPDVLRTIKLPVQFALAEVEHMQVSGWDVLNEVRGYLRNCKRAKVELQYHTGHNASMHHIARSYHLRAIAFFEECLVVGQGYLAIAPSVGEATPAARKSHRRPDRGRCEKRLLIHEGGSR